jgi:alkylated DNA repair protein (DNA oxidative demethylase)
VRLFPYSPQAPISAVRVPLEHGDVVVWGGPARLRYHGVNPLKPGHHALVGEHRINLTFRKAA